MPTSQQLLRAEKNAEIELLAGLSLTEVTPSRRDFAMFVATQKRGVALVPRLERADPDTGRTWPGCDLRALAQAYDEADAAAVAVATAGLYGGSITDLLAVAEAVTAPVLRDDWCLHPRQVYQARLHGADAIVVPLAQLDAERTAELLRIAGALHMAVVLEVASASELPLAIASAPACIGLRCAGADGTADMERLRALTAPIPRQRTVLLLSEVATLDALRGADGLIDAAVVGDALLDSDDPAARLREWQED